MSTKVAKELLKRALFLFFTDTPYLRGTSTNDSPANDSRTIYFIYALKEDIRIEAK